MQSVFILGASRLQVPAILKAKEKGLFVYALDYDPEAAGRKYADRFLEISTIDRNAVYRAALQYHPDFIITSTSDMPVRTVSWVCEKLGKETDISYEGSVRATDKLAMRNCMKQAGVPIPAYHAIRTAEELEKIAGKMPDRFILKPTDNAASRGVVLIDQEQKPDLEEAFRYTMQYSRGGTALAEEYMTGPEVSVEAFSVDGIPHIITITDKIVTEVPYFVELGHTEPSRLPDDQQQAITELAMRAIRAIGMRNGPTHTEIKVTPDGPKLVEIAARLGGDFITSKLVPLSSGVDMIECSFAILLGESVQYHRTKNQGAAIRFLHGKKGILESIEGTEEVRQMTGVREVEIYKKIGNPVQPPENSSDRIGHVIATGKDAEEAALNAERAAEKVVLRIL